LLNEIEERRLHYLKMEESKRIRYCFNILPLILLEKLG